MLIKTLNHLLAKTGKTIDYLGEIKLSLAASPEKAAPGTLIFFPCSRLRLACGLTGLIAFVPPDKGSYLADKVDRILGSYEVISANRFTCGPPTDAENCWGGAGFLSGLADRIYSLKSFSGFDLAYHDPELQQKLAGFSSGLSFLIKEEAAYLDAHWVNFSSLDLEIMNNRLILLSDIAWGIKAEFLKNIEKVGEISSHFPRHNQHSLWEFYRLVLVLNNLDQLEVRGRDSSGISTAFYLSGEHYERFLRTIEIKDLTKEFTDRKNIKNLLSHSISVTKFEDRVSLVFTHKTAAVIGRLGDNVNRLKNQIRHDRIFFEASRLPKTHTSTIAHTRWASVGAITEENCHPVDNETRTGKFERIFPVYGRKGKIQVVLNGDIDNYQEIKDFLQEKHNFVIDDKVTADTKVIPLKIEHFLLEGYDLTESFRLAVNSFEGSHAITMHSDLMPEKIFLALRGSGQAIFVGLAHDSYIPASEIYGFVEQTSKYIKLEGEAVINGKTPQGEIVILDKNPSGGLSGITSLRYNGTKRSLTEKDILHTNITTRDINRAGNPHFFLKEVSEAPKSIEKTIKGRVGIQKKKGKRQVFFNLGEEIIPLKLVSEIKRGKLKNIYFIGQGTAGVACNGIAGIFQDIFKNLRLGCHINTESKNASEFSGFCLKPDMSDSLIIAVSQSGSTTDTNRAIDLAGERKAFTMAIVNRRDSDITTKVDGVFYTSDGRDIEMSVASTKAFYSQITAGYLLALYFARALGMSEKEQLACVREISKLPAAIEQVLAEKEVIREAADRLALIKRYWAVVGSGPNKVAADEIRIKLSELCYKTISSDVVEDKKHIDLSAEPLIVVCAAGVNESVLGDIVKDVAIFKAHGAVPIVIANKGEKRFHKIADAVLPAPEVGERLAPVINTVIGHIWGYYAACTIDNESKIFSAFHTETARAVGHFKSAGRSIYELISDRDYQAHLKNFLAYFTHRRAEGKFASILEVKTASELTLLLKYLEGKLPLWECKEDFPFSQENEAVSMFLNCLEQAVNELSRPIDAIKHQAKTVTVGTSRLIQDLSGCLFDEIKIHHRSTQYLSNFNIATLKRLQEVLEEVSGSSLYEITGLDYHGSITEGTIIRTVRKIGSAANMKSRADEETVLKGTKKMVMRTGEVFVGTGKSDKAQIIIIPFQPDSGGKTFLLLLHIAFKTEVHAQDLIYALGDKYDDIKDTFVESNLEWNDQLLTNIAVRDLFIYSDEAISDMLITRGDGNVS